MKLDIKKHTYTVCNNYSGLPFEMQLLKAIKKGQNRLRDFSTRIQQGENENDVIRNRISNFDKRHISQPKIQ